MDTRMLEFAGRKTSHESDYRQFLSVFEKLGIRVNIDFIEENHSNRWSSFEDAVKDNLWMFFGITPEEEEKLRIYMKENLIQTDSGVQLDYERICRWAVMWWEQGS